MFRYYFIFILTLIGFSNACFSQIKELYPVSSAPLNFSKEGEKEFNMWKESRQTKPDTLSHNDDYSIVSYTDSVKDTEVEYVYLTENYWDVLPAGCSWYCGAMIVNVTASSSLPSQGGVTYKAKNIHDHSYKTAWVEGVKGAGIGESIEYTFDAATSRVWEIIIANGYVKSATAWKNNGRVKKLKLYLQGLPYAILNLNDERSEQTFKVGPFGYDFEVLGEKVNTMSPWKIRFEILKVYPGAKYEDTAITEIYFTGHDPH